MITILLCNWSNRLKLTENPLRPPPDEWSVIGKRFRLKPSPKAFQARRDDPLPHRFRYVPALINKFIYRAFATVKSRIPRLGGFRADREQNMMDRVAERGPGDKNVKGDNGRRGSGEHLYEDVVYHSL